MSKQGEPIKKGMVITCVTAFSLIIFEICLSRFFAVILDNNYVFLVISMATLGIGFGGYAAYQIKHHLYKRIHQIAIIYLISVMSTTVVMYVLPHLGVIIYVCLSFIPFLLGGMLVAGMMQHHSQHIHMLYFSDLVGAGLGAVAAIFLMDIFNPIQTVGITLVVTALLFAWAGFREIGKRFIYVQTIVLLIFMFNVIYPFERYLPFQAYMTSPNNVFINEKDTKIIYSSWNAFSRTDVYDADDDDLLYITIDGGAVSPISKYDGDLRKVNYLESTTSALAFQTPSRERALIIGVGGGQEVLVAQMKGFRNVESVDINAGSFQAVHSLLSFSGDVLQQQGVQSVVSDGRSYIRKTKNRYDLIYLSLVKKASDNGVGLALTENYIFTQEAMKEYMRKLTDRGQVAFLLHDEAELGKVQYAAIKYFRELQVPESEIKNHIAIVGTYQHLGHVVQGMNESKITRPLIIIKSQPFDTSTSRAIFEETKRIQQIPIHIPYMYDQYAALRGMLSDLKVNVNANRDDMPFFYSRYQGVPISLILILGITLATAIFMFRKTKVPYGRALYFSGLAIGFMMIEVVLIQRLVLPLGHPTSSFVLVLGVLLVSGGLGSLFSAKKNLCFGKRYLPLLIVGMFTFIVEIILLWYGNQAVYVPMVYRIVGFGFILFVLGFFMGMPFPYGLQRLDGHQTAICWGLNGIMTVAGSILAAILSLSFGFVWTMGVGAGIYMLLFCFEPRLR
ncbi:spermine synthase [Paenibacillus chondroitinus]|uniref:Spermine synthase n=1 Tax=Paenibacillus chondroitinus TaxID=59842 RepID=A0ABU6DGJ1_9BACL|nr:MULTISPECIES: spermine synthase [Paenibacillus]MCY9659484.1 spermine synthase [Paenibacillus anseongense]MEB4796879.1 spermine synthase [Paenibacillus chondroitinus]